MPSELERLFDPRVLEERWSKPAAPVSPQLGTTTAQVGTKGAQLETKIAQAPDPVSLYAQLGAAVAAAPLTSTPKVLQMTLDEIGAHVAAIFGAEASLSPADKQQRAVALLGSLDRLEDLLEALELPRR